MAWAAVAGAATSAVVGSLMNDGSGSGGGGGAAYDPAVSQAQARNLNSQTDIANSLWQYYQQNYQPNETNVINAGAQINSPEAVSRMQGQVNADQTAQFDAARKAAETRRAGLGINPASPAASADDNTMALAEAGSKAGAINAVKPTLDAQARQYNFDVAGMGKNLPASSMSGFGSAASGFGALQNANTNAANSAFNRGVTSSYMRGQAAAPFVKGAQDWFKNNPIGGWGTGGGTLNGPSAYLSGGSSGGYNPASPSYDATSGGGQDYFSYADGGLVRGRGVGMADGGEVEGPGTGTSDSIPAAGPDDEPDADDQYHLSDGEYIIPADVVQTLGTKYFDNLIDKYHEPVNRPNPGQAKRGFGVGGI